MPSSKLPLDAEQLREYLLQRARAAAERAHAPYSKFRVGAALLSGNQILEGCNVENASFGLTMCAERVTLFSAVAGGLPRPSHLALSCIDAPADAALGTKMPCGACRQVLAELGAPNIEVIVDGVGCFSLEQLLPQAFTLES